MIPDSARLLARSRCFTIAAVALLISFTTPLPLLAQDNNPDACAANENMSAAECAAQNSASIPEPEPQPEPESEPEPEQHSMDWVSECAVPTEKCGLNCRLCGGQYQDPLANEDQ